MHDWISSQTSPLQRFHDHLKTTDPFGSRNHHQKKIHSREPFGTPQKTSIYKWWLAINQLDDDFKSLQEMCLKKSPNFHYHQPSIRKTVSLDFRCSRQGLKVWLLRRSVAPGSAKPVMVGTSQTKPSGGE